MNARALAALIVSLISQLHLVLVLLLPPPLNLFVAPNFTSFSCQNDALHKSFISLLRHILSTSDVVAAFSVVSHSRKRKRDDSERGEIGRDPCLRRLVSSIPRSKDSFKHFFLMKPSTFEWLCGLLDPLLDCRDPVSGPLNLPAEIRLGIGLFRLATGSDFSEISARFGVSETHSKFCVKQLCRVLCTNYRFWVGFPGQSDIDSVSARFESLTGLPNCCGILSCARFHTIAAQIVVDSSSRILSIAAGFHSHKSDHVILNSSSLYHDVSEGVILNSLTEITVNDVRIPQYLVGVGKYPLLPWLVVPFLDPSPGSGEEKLNNTLHLMHRSWRKADASLRNWGVLNGDGEIIDRKSMVACIGACSILHNMLIMKEDDSALCVEVEDEVVEERSRSVLTGSLIGEQEALLVRRALCTRAETRI